MRPLTAEEFAELEGLCSAGDRWIESDEQERANESLVDLGYAVVCRYDTEEGEVTQWSPTGRAHLALRVHLAALAAGVVM